MEGVVAWLAGVPVASLYALLSAAAFIEGILPFMPGDVVAALLAFLIARASGDLALTIALVTIGSLAGAVAMWGIGRRFGTAWLARQLHRVHLMPSTEQAELAERRVATAYREYGWVALFVSRFVPGIRAVVPGVAGALRLPFWEAMLIFAVASTLWYGGIAWIAFRVGRDWETVRAALGSFARDVGLGATAAALLVVLLFWRSRRRAKRRAAAAARGAAPPAA